jgi:hypothetical protein
LQLRLELGKQQLARSQFRSPGHPNLFHKRIQIPCARLLTSMPVFHIQDLTPVSRHGEPARVLYISSSTTRPRFSRFAKCPPFKHFTFSSWRRFACDASKGVVQDALLRMSIGEAGGSFQRQELLRKRFVRLTFATAWSRAISVIGLLHALNSSMKREAVEVTACSAFS